MRGPRGPRDPADPAGPPGGVLNFADFYALMPPDNAATVAPGTDVSFPNHRDGYRRNDIDQFDFDGTKPGGECRCPDDHTGGRRTQTGVRTSGDYAASIILMRVERILILGCVLLHFTLYPPFFLW